MHRNTEVMKRFWIVCEEYGKTLKRAIDGPISESERLVFSGYLRSIAVASLVGKSTDEFIDQLIDDWYDIDIRSADFDPGEVNIRVLRCIVDGSKFQLRVYGKLESATYLKFGVRISFVSGLGLRKEELTRRTLAAVDPFLEELYPAIERVKADIVPGEPIIGDVEFVLTLLSIAATLRDTGNVDTAFSEIPRVDYRKDY